MYSWGLDSAVSHTNHLPSRPSATIGHRLIRDSPQYQRRQLSRMGGSGDGSFARLPRPVPKRTNEQSLDLLYKPNERLPVYQKSLSSLKILGEDSRAGQIAVSPDERRVYYVMHGKHWLVTNGKTEELHLTEQ